MYSAISLAAYASILFCAASFHSQADVIPNDHSHLVTQRSESLDGSFVVWAGEHAAPLSEDTADPAWRDLEPLGNAIGNAKIVTLGDNAGCGEQSMALRNRLFRYLVERKSFTAIAIESGFVEGRDIGRYVRAAAGSVSAVVERGLGRPSNNLPQKDIDLVQWVREYNDDRSHPRKLNFYGIDVLGNGWISNTGHPDLGIREILRYLDRVDQTAARSFRLKLGDLLSESVWSGQNPPYLRLGAKDRDTITASIAEMIALMRRREREYENKSGVEEFEWAYQDAINASYVNLGFQPGSAQDQDNSQSLFALREFLAGRENALFDNVEWIIGREGAAGKILIVADNAHVATVPIRRGINEGAARLEIDPLGEFLRKRHGDALFSIAMASRTGPIGRQIPGVMLDCRVPQYWNVPADGVDAALAKISVPAFFLDLRHVPAEAGAWLNQRPQLGPDGVFAVSDVAINQAFDAVVYVDHETLGPVHSDLATGDHR